MTNENNATLKAAQGGVTEAHRSLLQEARDQIHSLAGGFVRADQLIARIDAALSAQQGQGEASQVVAWMTKAGRVINTETRERVLANAELGGEYVVAAKAAEAYCIPLFTAPPAQPAERVPEASWLADQLCDLRNKWAEGCEANWLETDDNHPDDWMAKELRKRWIAAYPAPSPARGDGGDGRSHRWDEDGERCVVCGDKDWMGGPCNGPRTATTQDTRP